MTASFVTDRRAEASDEVGLPRPYRIATLATLGLTVVATAVGLLTDVYRDPQALLSQALGQDALTLVVAVPALAVSLSLARRGSLRGYVAWLGVTGYLLYTYATYSFMTTFNELYFVYVALFALTLYAFVGGILRLDPDRVKRAFGDRPVYGYVVYFLLAVGLTAMAWLSDLVPALLEGTRPEALAGTGLPSPVVQSLDFGVLLPALALTAYWLRKRRAWAYVATGVLLVKVTTLGLAVLAMAAVQTLDGQVVPLPMLAIFGILSLLGLGFTGRYLLVLGSSPGASDGGGATEPGPGVGVR